MWVVLSLNSKLMFIFDVMLMWFPNYCAGEEGGGAALHKMHSSMRMLDVIERGRT